MDGNISWSTTLTQTKISQQLYMEINAFLYRPSWSLKGESYPRMALVILELSTTATMRLIFMVKCSVLLRVNIIKFEGPLASTSSM